MISKIAFERDSGLRSITICLPKKANLIYHLHYIWTKWSHVRKGITASLRSAVIAWGGACKA
jgi:hypothetical protein